LTSIGKVASRFAGVVIACDLNDRIVTWSPAATEYFGREAGDVVGRTLHETLNLRDGFGNRLPAGNRAFREMIRHAEGIRPFRIQARKSSGESCCVDVTVVVVVGATSSEYGFIYLMRPTTSAAAEAFLSSVLSNDSHGHAPLMSSRLTPRQTEILHLLSLGVRPDRISTSLGISPHTLRRHAQNISRALGVHSRREAVSKAFLDDLL